MRIIVNREEFVQLMLFLEEEGYRWIEGQSPTMWSPWIDCTFAGERCIIDAGGTSGVRISWSKHGEGISFDEYRGDRIIKEIPVSIRVNRLQYKQLSNINERYPRWPEHIHSEIYLVMRSNEKYLSTIPIGEEFSYDQYLEKYVI